MSGSTTSTTFGAFFMSYIGDKFDRTTVLVATLFLMGASTFLAGCLPTYDQVGVLAPIVLVILRLCPREHLHAERHAGRRGRQA